MTKDLEDKQREEYPLRGVLLCPACNRNLTGNPSKSRNGSYYDYYH